MTPNLRGSLFMVAAMAGFAVEDAFLKSATQVVAPGLVLILMGMIGIAVFSGLALRAGTAPLPRSILSRTMAIRSGFEIMGRLFYALAIAFTPLSTASAILQASPLLVVLGAAWLFGEKVGAKRWALIVLGFVGVLIILRPGLEGFSPLSIFALLGMAGFAGRDLATRAARPSLTNAQLGVAGFVMLALSGSVILAVTGGAQVPSLAAMGQILAASVFGIAGYSALTEAMRSGEVSVVTPFRYSRLMFAMILGVTVFGERPDAMDLLGSLIIVGCGVMILTQGRRIA